MGREPKSIKISKTLFNIIFGSLLFFSLTLNINLDKFSDFDVVFVINVICRMGTLLTSYLLFRVIAGVRIQPEFAEKNLTYGIAYNFFAIVLVSFLYLLFKIPFEGNNYLTYFLSYLSTIIICTAIARYVHQKLMFMFLIVFIFAILLTVFLLSSFEIRVIA